MHVSLVPIRYHNYYTGTYHEYIGVPTKACTAMRRRVYAPGLTQYDRSVIRAGVSSTILTWAI